MELQIIPYYKSSFQHKIIYVKEGESVNGQKKVITFIMDQCVLSDTKIYNIPIGTRKCCKHFLKKVEP